MKRINRYPELTNSKTQTMEIMGKAKAGKRRERDSAKELHDLLRTYTYRLIGLGNAFRRISRDYSSLDGSNWRYNRGMATDRLMELSKKLYSMDPYNVDEILKIEKELEAIVIECTKR